MQITLPPFSALLRGRSPLWGITLICALLLWMGGCQKVERTNDPKLKPLQEMLDAQLPAGTPESKVLTFLDNRGYPVLPSGEPGTIVTSIRHIDQQTVTPVTARVTFYFDANRKLSTYELQRTFNDPLPKAKEQPAEAPPAEPQQLAQPNPQ